MKFLQITLFSLIATYSFAQSDTERAFALKDKAVQLMDSGNVTKAIELLNRAKKLDPDYYIYDYEIGFAHYINKDYQEALRSYKKVIKYKDITDQCYQMLGNLYDINGEPEKALKTYDQGLKKFPKSGKLFLEKGNVYWVQKKYGEALGFYEKGIFNDPNFPSNYYRATLIYCATSEKIWGMIYGEIFMNLEKNSHRTHEIGKLLYDTYASNIHFEGDTSINVTFSKADNVINISMEELEENPSSLLDKLTLPFANSAYEQPLSIAAVGQNSININSLNSIRTSFIDLYYSMDHAKKYPVALFEFNKQMISEGVFEAYNFWLLSNGNFDEFKSWKATHETEWNRFLEWFSQHQLEFNDKTKFYSDKY